jgi:transcriptional regulator with XRE-family HTH domain
MNAARPTRRKRSRGVAATSAKAATDIDAVVGRNVRIRRMAKGFSQTQLAKRLGITFQQVQKYEKGRNRIGAGRLARIAQVLDAPLSTLLDHAGGETEAAPLAFIADRRALRLAQASDAIDDAPIRLSFVELVEELARSETRARR